MARNTDQNAYWYVGIPRKSATYQRLAQDASEKGVSIPKLIAMRIDDFYKYGPHSVNLPAVEAPSEPPVVAEEQTTELCQEELNALAALENW